MTYWSNIVFKFYHLGFRCAKGRKAKHRLTQSIAMWSGEQDYEWAKEFRNQRVRQHTVQEKADVYDWVAIPGIFFSSLLISEHISIGPLVTLIHTQAPLRKLTYTILPMGIIESNAEHGYITHILEFPSFDHPKLLWERIVTPKWWKFL